MHPHKETILEALYTHKGDDYARASWAFRKYTPTELMEQHGESEKTRQQVLDGYKAHADKCDAAIAWAKTL